MCEYCNGDENTQQPLPDNEEATVWTICKDKIEIVTISRQLQVFSCNINYCPMCGRKLKEESK